MQKPLSLLGRLCTALLLLALALIIHSCRKETKLTAQEVNAAKAAEMFPMADAKTWFNGNKQKLATRIKLNATDDFLANYANFTPVWDSARTALDTNYYAVEVPARYIKKPGITTDSTATNINGLTRLLVLKSKKYGTMSAVLMQIHGDAGVSLNNVHYMAIPAGFSGHIFYTSLQGLYINGYIYKNGKVTFKSSNVSQTKPTGPKILMAGDQDCWLITISHYTRQCVDYGDYITCDDWEYEYSDNIIYCQDGGGGGGTVSPPNNCPPAGGNNPPITVTAVKGKLIVNIRDPGDGGTGDPTDQNGQSPCVVAPVPVPQVTPVDTTKDPCGEKLKLQNIVASTAVTNANASIRSSTANSGTSPLTEYGGPVKVNSLGGAIQPVTTTPGTYVANDPIYNGSWSVPNPTWDSANGYTVGWLHTHVDEAVLSPDDIIAMAMPLFAASGPLSVHTASPADRAYYEANVFVEALTPTTTYMATINNKSMLSDVYNYYAQISSNALDMEYQNRANKYLTDHASADLGEASSYALKSIFGDAINFYKSPANSNNFVPITAAGTGLTATVGTNPCNP